MKIDWPPLVGSDTVPRLVVLRDLVLTVLAWVVFAWMLRHAISLAIDWFREPFGQLTHLQPPDWPNIWNHLRNYVALATLLAIWISFWAIYRSKTLRPQDHTAAAVSPLPDGILCQRYGVQVEQLQRWQALRVMTVDVQSDGRIASDG